MEEKIPDLEILSSNFRKMDQKMYFMKEQLSKFELSEKLNINFNKCHVAISPNGGYIAICKKKDYYIEDQYSKIREYILIMHQDGKTQYSIPIDWIYERRWIVELDFNEKEQLFGICNDGSILKFDIINSKAVKKITIEHFQNDNIYKAKFFGKGFFALTDSGIFYYVNDIKNPELFKFFPMRDILGFSNDIEFLIIPGTNSKSKKNELLITNEKGPGVIHFTPSGAEFSNENNVNKIEGLSIILKDKLEVYNLNLSEETTEENTMGKILSLAISPSKSQIAFLNSRFRPS